MASKETHRMVLAAAAACENKKAEDTKILELDPMDSGFTDFFVITSSTNERQTQAIADEVELRLKKDFGTYPNSVEGRRQGEWVLMDYVDFVVHIFLAERRAYYDIERLRKSAKAVDIEALTATLTEKTKEARKKAPVKKAEKTTAKPAKKVAAKKTAAKKTVAKKPVVKKAAPKKATKPAKKVVAKAVKAVKAAKPAAKKAAKKAPAKKAAAKSTRKK